MGIFDFEKQLKFSKEKADGTDDETLFRYLKPYGCVDIRKATEAEDKVGIDRIVIWDSGVRRYVDFKARDSGKDGKGFRSFWERNPKNPFNEPELALETWSVIPETGTPGKIGWTLDRAKRTHYTFHTFSPIDTLECYLLPFDLLRIAFERNLVEWLKPGEGGFGPAAQQRTFGGGRYWKSECLFIPATVVLLAISEAATLQPTVGLSGSENEAVDLRSS